MSKAAYLLSPNALYLFLKLAMERVGFDILVLKCQSHYLTKGGI